jgi:hypothetical protein
MLLILVLQKAFTHLIRVNDKTEPKPNNRIDTGSGTFTNDSLIEQLVNL